MSHKKRLDDLAECIRVGGCEEPSHLGVSIEDDYFWREAKENREAAYVLINPKEIFSKPKAVGPIMITMKQIRKPGQKGRLKTFKVDVATWYWERREKLIEISDAIMHSMHNERYQKHIDEKEAHLEPNYDEDKFEPWVEKIECQL
jgi:hypothetical protein